MIEGWPEKQWYIQRQIILNNNTLENRNNIAMITYFVEEFS